MDETTMAQALGEAPANQPIDASLEDALQQPAPLDPEAQAPAGEEACEAADVADLDGQAREEAAAAEEAARAAAEKAAREAQERLERMEVELEQAQERAAAATETIATGAGFVTQAGVYYDLSAPSRVAFQYADLTQRQQKDMQADAGESADVASDGDEPDDEASTSDVATTEPVDDLALDAYDAPDDGDYVDPQEFARRVARLTQSVARQSLHREIFYKTLAFCEESRPLRAIEEQIATFAEFKHAAASQYHFIRVLEEAGGLQRFELDEQGEVVLPEQKAGLTEDQIDDLVCDYAFMTTDVGMAVVEQHTPRARIIELLGLVPERKDAYIELMDFVADEPRTYTEISQLFDGRDVLWRLDSHGEPQKMQPSVFVDKLEAAGGIEYRDGWVLTEQGRSLLEELRAA